MKKSINLKKLLTTTSILTVLTAMSSQVNLAQADVMTMNTDANLTTDAGWNPAAVPTSGNSVKFDADTLALKVDKDGFDISGIDINGKKGSKIDIMDNVIIGSIYDSTKIKKLNINIKEDNKTLTLNGNKGDGADVNIYTGIQGMHIKHDGTKIIVEAKDGNLIELRNTFKGGKVNNLTLIAKTDTTLTNDSAKNIGNAAIHNAKLTYDIAGTPDIVTKINFEDTTSVLENNKEATFSGEFSGAEIGNATFTVNENTTVHSQKIAELKTINVAKYKELNIKVTEDMTFKQDALEFGDLAILCLEGERDVQITLPGVGHGALIIEGILKLVSTKGTLSIDFNGATKQLKMRAVNIDGSSLTKIGGILNIDNMVIGSQANTKVGDTEFASGVTAEQLIFVDAGSLLFKMKTDIENISFQDKNATIQMQDKANLNTTKITKGANAKIEFLGKGNLKGEIEKLGVLRVGAGDVKLLTAGDHNITKIEANGNQTLTFPKNFTLNGAIDNPGVHALNLKFTGPAKINGTVGETEALGDMTYDGGINNADLTQYNNQNQVEKNAIRFNQDVRVKDIILTNGAGAGFAKQLQANNIDLKHSVLALKGDTTARYIRFENSTLKIDNNIILDAEVTSVGSIGINLGHHQLTLKKPMTLDTKLVIYTQPTDDYNSIGNIVLAVGSEFNMNNATELEVKVNTQDHLQVFGKNYKFINDVNVVLKLPNDKNVDFNISDTNNRIIWEILWNEDEDIISLIATDKILDRAQEIVNKDSSILNDEKNEIIDALNKAPEALKNAIVNETTLEIVKTIEELTTVPIVIMTATRSAIYAASNSNITNLNARMPSISSQTPAAIAAGDEIGAKKHGIWVSPIYSRSSQKAHDRMPGYNINGTGGTVGFDNMINDGLLAGVAMTYVNSNVKYKNQLQGSKTKINSYLLSFYGVKEFSNNFIIQGILIGGYNKVNNKGQRGAKSIGFSTVTSKFSTINYSGELLLGHNIRFKEAVITPMFGGRYSKFIEKAYDEKGSNTGNLKMAKKKYDKFEIIAGLKSSIAIEKANMTITPQVYGFITHDVNGKKIAVKARFVSTDTEFPTRASKVAKTSYNVGTALMIKHKALEYGANYDLQLAKKYTGHQASLKMKVNF